MSFKETMRDSIMSSALYATSLIWLPKHGVLVFQECAAEIQLFVAWIGVVVCCDQHSKVIVGGW